MTEKQKKILNDVIVTLDSLTVTGVGNMSKVVGCINALSEALQEDKNGGQDNK